MKSTIKIDSDRVYQRIVSQVLPFFTENIPNQVRQYYRAVKMEICFAILLITTVTATSVQRATEMLSIRRNSKKSVLPRFLRIYDPSIPRPTHVRKTLARWPKSTIKARYKHINSLLVKEARSSELYRAMHGGRGKSRVKMAASFDLTEVPFHGRNKALKDETSSTRSKGSGGRCFCYLTLQLVCPGLRLVIGVRPVKDDSDIGRMMTLMLRRAKREGIYIGRIYLDRGFFNTNVLKSVKMNFSEVKTVMPVLRNQRIKNRIQQHYEENGYSAGIFDMYFGRKGKPRVRYKIIVRPKSKKRRENQYDKRWKSQPVDKDGNILVYNDFIYFCVLRPPKELEEETTYDVFRQLMLEYRRRWGIETGYKQIKSIWGWTTSTSYSFRLFLVLSAFLVYNIWVIENLHLIDKEMRERGTLTEDYRCCQTPTNDDVEAYDFRIMRSKTPKYARTSREFPTRSWKPRPVEKLRYLLDVVFLAAEHALELYISNFDTIRIEFQEGYDPPDVKMIKESVPVL